MNTQTKRAPIINAPPLLTGIAVLLIALQVIWFLMPAEAKVQMVMSVGVIPERFWGWVAGAQLATDAAPPYSNAFAAIAPLLFSFLIQGGWFAAIINAALLVGIGKPIYTVILAIRSDNGLSASFLFVLFLLVCQIGGGVSYLLLNNPAGLVLVGIPGVIAGLIAAVLLLDGDDDSRILSRRFLTATSIFIVAIALLTIVSPGVLGGQFAWEASAGGYIAGAIFARFLIWDAVRKLDM